MRLYLYDHCPYCTRVLMAFRLKGVPVEVVYLAHDDEVTPICMIGRKMLPILEDRDGFMGESLDIVRKMDMLAEPQLFDGVPNVAIEKWLAAWKATIYGLVLPRVANPVFPEFRSNTARAAFVTGKESSYGPFEKMLSETATLSAAMTSGLTALRDILPRPDSVGIDDIMLFPMLRSLSIVDGLRVDDAVQDYMDRMAQFTGIPTPPVGHVDHGYAGPMIPAPDWAKVWP